MSEQIPSIEGSSSCLLKQDERGIDVEAAKTSPVKATFPSTPATVCASTCSKTTPATSCGIFSSGWSESSAGNSPQGNVPSPTSSSSTESELEATQLDPGADHQADESENNGRNDLSQRPHPGVSGNGARAGTLGREGISSEGRGAKRPREVTPHADKLQQAPGGAGPVSPSAGDQQRPSEVSSSELSSDLESVQRKRRFLADSQYPRLDGNPASASRSRWHREQSHYSGENSIRNIQGSATGNLCRGVLGSSPTPSRGNSSHGSPGRADRGTSKDVSRNGYEKEASETLPAQDSMDTCEGTLLSHSPDSSDQSNGNGMDSGGVGLGAASTGDMGRNKVSGWLGLGVHSSQTPPTDVAKPAAEDPEVVDAVKFRRVGISLDGDWKSTKFLLKQLGWQFSSRPVSKLCSNYWVLRPGATVKTAERGADKFAGNEETGNYVRKTLQLLGSSRSDTRGENGEETGQEGGEVDGEQAHGAGEDEGQGAGCDVKDDEDQESDELKQVELLASGSKGQALQTALEALNPSNAPDVLQQRTTEFEQVLRFVATSVNESSGGSLYLCGVPGTGKTQTMVNVQAKVLEMFSEGKTPAPVFHSFTGTEFTSPTAMHDALWRAITGANEIQEGADIEKKLGSKLRYQRKIPTASSPMLVVVLDEIDQLMTNNRQVLRKLFEWSDAPKSRLILVGLANSLDFDVNFSHLKKAPQRLLFQSYTPEDLVSILTERVGATVHRSAIQFCAKKAAATTGDARRAINMCREAVVLAKQELQKKLDDATSEEERLQVGTGDGNNLVTMGHMAKAVAAGNAGKYSAAIAGLSFHAKVVLSVAAAAVGDVPDRRVGNGANVGKCSRLSQGDLHEKCMGAWRRLKTGEAPGQLEFTGIIDLLSASGLVALKSKQQTGGRARELMLRIEFADLAAALEDQPFFKTVTDI